MPSSCVNISDDSPVVEILDFWQPLSDSQRQLIVDTMEVCRYKRNAVIYHEDDIPQHMLVLTHGKVKVYKDGVGGRNQIIRVIKPIEMFGYRAYFANEHYRTSAMAFEPTTVVKIPMETVVQLMSENQHLNMLIIHHLSVQLGQSDDRTVNLTQKHVRGRLAEALLFLMDSYGAEEDGCTLSIYLSREDLANLSNMTTSNAIRTLSAFASEKLIATDGRKIKIIQVEELLRISKMG